MLDQQMKELKNDQVLVHDINSSISALQGAIDVIKDEWRTNPELVERIIPLTLQKVAELHLQLAQFRSNQQ